jgi:exosortase E/protease (VPEID-CTERM system)
VEVAPICSGVEGIGLIAALMGAFLYLERRELVWPRALLLLPLSGLLVWLLNVVRITALIAVGTWGSPAVALGGFHSKAGWILFTVAALGTVLLARRLTVFRRKELRTAVGMPAPLVAQEPSDAASTETDELGAFTAAYLAPMLAVLGVSMLTGLVPTDGFDGLYPLRVLAAGVALWHFRRRYSSLAVSRPWLGLGAGILLGAAWIAVASQPTGAAPHPVAVALGALPSAAAAAWVGMRLFGSVVAVPVVEELAFRGFLMRRLVDRDFYRVRLDRLSWPALLLSSVGYGLLHAQWWQGIAAGLLYGLLVIARGRLTDAIVAHGATNAVLAAYVLVTGDWSLLG